MNQIATKILLVAIFILPINIAMAQRLQSDGGLDAGSVSKEMRNGQSSARVIVQSSLRLNYKSNMGDLSAKDIRRGSKNQLNVDTLYFYIADGDNKRRLTISADGYPDEVLTFSFTPKQTYNYVVFDPALANSNNQEEAEKGQYLVMNFTPSDVELVIDDESPETISNGVKSTFLHYGEHRYTVSSRLYKSKSGVVNIGADRTNINVDLVPNFGYIDIVTTPSGASVEINDMVVGTTPYKSDKLRLGEYTVRLSTPNFVPVTQIVSLAEGEKRVSLNKSLSSYLSGITITCPMADANILINEEQRGTGSWSGELLPGTYEVKSIKDGHRAKTMVLTVEKNTPQKIKIDAPTPMYGKLNINSEQVGVIVSIDGKQLGEAPNVFSNILAGKRKIEVSKKDYISASYIIEIKEGKITEYMLNPLISKEDSESYKLSQMLTLKAPKMPDKTYRSLGKNNYSISVKEFEIPYGYTEISEIWNWRVQSSTHHYIQGNGRTATRVETYLCSIEKIIIPNTVVKIGANAFRGVTNLKQVIMPNSVKNIDTDAFYGCNKGFVVVIHITSPVYKKLQKMGVNLETIL